MANNEISKICVYCKKRFRATSGVAKFCSDRCHLLASAECNGNCLVWKGNLDKDGYGIVRFRGRIRKRAHRASYEEFIGPIPVGMMVCHKCDNPSCIEPTHLFTGTAFSNKEDSIAKGRHVHGTRVYWKNRLTEEDVLAIRSDKRPGARIAAEYGVTKENIYAILSGKTWKHLI